MPYIFSYNLSPRMKARLIPLLPASQSNRCNVSDLLTPLQSLIEVSFGMLFASTMC